MNKQAKELYNKLRGLGDKGIGLVSIAEVKSVDKGACKCIVLVDGLEIADVRLKATKDGENGFKLFPSVGSTVLVERIADGDFAVQMMSEVESVVLEIENKKIEIDADGCFIGSKNNSLLNVIEMIIDACLKIVVIQGTNPDYTKLAEAKTKVKTFLK